MGSLHIVAETAFDELLRCWRRHHDLQHRRGVAVSTLSESRHELEQARQRMHELRTAMYPTADESREVIASTVCTSLDEVVHLNWTRRDLSRPGTLTCLCGQPVTLD